MKCILTVFLLALCTAQAFAAQRCISTTAYALKKKSDRHLSRVELFHLAEGGLAQAMKRGVKNGNFLFFNLNEIHGVAEIEKFHGCPVRLPIEDEYMGQQVVPLVAVTPFAWAKKHCFWEGRISGTENYKQILCTQD